MRDREKWPKATESMHMQTIKPNNNELEGKIRYSYTANIQNKGESDRRQKELPDGICVFTLGSDREFTVF